MTPNPEGCTLTPLTHVSSQVLCVVLGDKHLLLLTWVHLSKGLLLRAQDIYLLNLYKG